MSQQSPEWSFRNSLGQVITTGDATTAMKYRTSDGFTEITGTPALEQVVEGDTGVTVKPYTEWLREDLENEVERRNDARGDDDVLVEVAAPGNKPELAAALEADDQLHS